MKTEDHTGYKTLVTVAGDFIDIWIEDRDTIALQQREGIILLRQDEMQAFVAVLQSLFDEAEDKEERAKKREQQ